MGVVGVLRFLGLLSSSFFAVCACFASQQKTPPPPPCAVTRRECRSRLAHACLADASPRLDYSARNDNKPRKTRGFRSRSTHRTLSAPFLLLFGGRWREADPSLRPNANELLRHPGIAVVAADHGSSHAYGFRAPSQQTTVVPAAAREQGLQASVS